MQFVHWMMPLRLTCKAINAKTNDFFAKTAFKRLGISFDSQSLSRFTEITSVPAFASKIERLSLWHFDRSLDSYEAYAREQENASSQVISRRKRAKAASQLREADAELNDKDFVQRYVLTDQIVSRTMSISVLKGSSRPLHKATS